MYRIIETKGVTRKIVCRKIHTTIIDENRKAYQRFFGIEGVEQYLIFYTLDEAGDTGYIVYIDNENDLDFIDKRDNSSWTEDDIQNFHRSLGKLQQAEAAPCHNLRKKQLLAFKQILGRAYLQILERDFSEVDTIIQDALLYLRQRNVEVARELFLSSAGTVALITAVTGLVLFFVGNRNIWIYGVFLGILGAFFSIWTRYGKEEMTGLASKSLHYLESISRLFIGSIAAIVALFAVRSGLVLAIGSKGNEFFLYCVVSFASGFSERFVPSLIEKLVNEQIK